ncbi:MAG: methylmalonyl-CoA decarboxylase [Dehalococcoidia bacterium]|nr:methylmalonyl-CoA decarboxylase [Dehalococcoidia bacterium]
MRDIVEEMRARREKIRTEMGGIDKIERQHARGRLTVRERIDRLVDAGSFFEFGTFARSERPEAKDISPGDGKVSGLATVAGRPISVAGDDVTVFRGSSAYVASKRTHKALELAVDNGHPFVYLGETGGARLPDTLGAEGFTRIHPSVQTARRQRAVPMVTAILGDSFGGSSFEAAFSDVVIQARGACLAVSSPRVIEIATTEKVSLEDLGGVDVHLRKTGQIDIAADDEDHALALIRDVLSYLPQNRWSKPELLPCPPPAADEKLYDVVPTARNRAYDTHRVLARLVDPRPDGSPALLELKPEFGRSLITAFARLGGRSVGILASNPMYFAGALDPDCCDKGARFIALCDTFNLPLVFLQDVPGYIVGKQPEHERLLNKAIMFFEALALAEVPKVTVVLRKAFGLAYYALAGNAMGGDFLFAWPGAEISFMDPAVGVNVVHAGKLDGVEDPAAERARLIAEWSKDTTPYGAAGIMNLDEIIDPAETRPILVRALAECDRPAPGREYRKPLASWPTCL